jgi:hypothetical protein
MIVQHLSIGKGGASATPALCQHGIVRFLSLSGRAVDARLNAGGSEDPADREKMRVLTIMRALLTIRRHCPTQDYLAGGL